MTSPCYCLFVYIFIVNQILYYFIRVPVSLYVQSHCNNSLQVRTLLTYIQEEKGVQVKLGEVAPLDPQNTSIYKVPHHENKNLKQLTRSMVW